jgi:DNA-binding NtrC family response regulator
MSAPPDKRRQRRPRIAIAIADDALRRRIAKLLEGEAFHVDAVESARDLRATASELGADAMVVERSALDDKSELLEAALGRSDSPGVIVIADEAGDAERADLIAAGATGVVDRADRDHRLVALARAEAQGGLDGPEVAGRDAHARLADFASRNARMRAFLDLVGRVVDSDSTLLVTGETGVGKERLARAIHAESARRDGPFVTVNCGALPENLLESELFGHERGAFTGADARRLGQFELAEGGTIFLDEIGEMPPHLQVNLLTVLQGHEIRRIGSEKPTRVDVRVMAATNRDLAQDVSEGRFREDLYYRLNVVSLVVPPLRERPEDIADLAGAIIKHFRVEQDMKRVEGITDEAMERLLGHDWPGNVRELANVIERAMLLCRGARIGPADLPEKLSGALPPASAAGGGPAAFDDALLELPLNEARKRIVEAFERAYLTGLLERAAGSVGRTAEEAGINPRTLYEKMKRHGLDKDDFKP